MKSNIFQNKSFDLKNMAALPFWATMSVNNNERLGNYVESNFLEAAFYKEEKDDQLKNDDDDDQWQRGWWRRQQWWWRWQEKSMAVCASVRSECNPAEGPANGPLAIDNHHDHHHDNRDHYHHYNSDNHHEKFWKCWSQGQGRRFPSSLIARLL